MRVGSLFSGYGGLDMAVGGELAWYSEIEPAACRVMEAHHPGVPNIGDVTQVDWSMVEPVDVLTGGYPCQPFSSAGQRKGEDDERHLWPHVRDAISALGPRVTVLENVRGHLTLGFASVLADLADLGLSARWGVVRASDAGAPHNRARLFVVATRDSDYPRSQGSNASTSVDEGWSTEFDDVAAGHRPATDSASAEWRVTESDDLRASDRATAESRERSSLVANTCVVGCRTQRTQSTGQQWTTKPDRYSSTSWGQYSEAITRWQQVIGRAAPSPTVQRNNRERLSPRFVEWMMGLPEGWVTGHGLTASQELKLLGNGVVPQQARLALELL